LETVFSGIDSAWGLVEKAAPVPDVVDGVISGVLGGIAGIFGWIGDGIVGAFGLFGGFFEFLGSYFGFIATLTVVDTTFIVMGFLIFFLALATFLLRFVFIGNLLSLQGTVMEGFESLVGMFTGVLFVTYGLLGAPISLVMIGAGFVMYWYAVFEEVPRLGAYSFVLMLVGATSFYIALRIGFVASTVLIPVTVLLYLVAISYMRHRLLPRIEEGDEPFVPL